MKVSTAVAITAIGVACSVVVYAFKNFETIDAAQEKKASILREQDSIHQAIGRVDERLNLMDGKLDQIILEMPHR